MFGLIEEASGHGTCSRIDMMFQVDRASITPIDRMTVAEVRERLNSNRREQARLDAENAALIARLEDANRDPLVPMLVSPERELMSHAGLSSREASAAIGRARLIGEIPEFAVLLAHGDTTAGHVDALARALRTVGVDTARFVESTPQLAEAATLMPVAEFATFVRDAARATVADGGLGEFERQRRSTYVRVWNSDDGMVQLRGAFDPERGAMVQGIINREVERMFHSGDDGTSLDPMPWVDLNNHRAAIALCAVMSDSIARGDSSDHPGPGARAEIVVHVGLDALTGSLEAAGRTVHGALLPVETVRRIACEADIIPVVLNGASVPIDLGRSKRLATAHQRRALETVHRTCAIPDCDTPYHHCQIHHIDYWESGGVTNLGNMVPLCTRHHHDAHEGGYTLMLDPTTRAVTFSPPAMRSKT